MGTRRILQSGTIALVGSVLCQPASAASTERISVSSGEVEANGDSYSAAVSGDGRFVAFVSDATNLVTDTNGKADVFLRDRANGGLTVRVSRSTGGAQANDSSSEPSINADGRFVAFTSLATNLVPDDTNGVSDVFVRGSRDGSDRAGQPQRR